jgi:hypothetical protein
VGILRRVVVTLAVACLGVPGLSACLGQAAAGPIDCTAYQDDLPEGKAAPLLLIMIDVADNSAQAAKRIASRVRPYLDIAVAEGQYVKLVASGGEGAGLAYSDCFTGEQVFLVDRNNKTREEKDRLAAGIALQEEIDHIVQAQPVSRTGSATVLLSRVKDEVDTLRAIPGEKIGKVTVLVWTDLLGMTENTDCLNVNGKQASVTIAEAVAKRCFETNQIPELGESIVRFLGVNENTGTRPQQDLARYLRGELCRRISTDCA